MDSKTHNRSSVNNKKIEEIKEHDNKPSSENIDLPRQITGKEMLF